MRILKVDILTFNGYSDSKSDILKPRWLLTIASDQNKPDGLFVITPKTGPGFVETLDVSRFHGVGPATTAKMNRLGVRTGLDLREQTLAFLQQQFGKSGPYYYWIARGVDERPVRANRIRKSLGAENTFAEDIYAAESARAALRPIIEKVWRACEQSRIRGRTTTLKVKYADFHQITRSHTSAAFIATQEEFEQLSFALLEPVFPVTKGIRLLGVTLSSLATEQGETDSQLRLCV